jgi:peptidylprolyl isomerase
MRRIAAFALPAVALAAALALAGCQTARPSAGWRPSPQAGVEEPSAVLAATSAADWRAIDPENLLLLELDGGGRVAIELAPDFAPVHVANIRRYARSGHWSAASVYRVQDNYVTQWGNGEPERPAPAGIVAVPPAEYDRPFAGLAFRPLGSPDAYAPVAGHSNGWPVGADPESGRAWLTHCYASVGVARDLAPDTGSGSELYTVIGHAPRHLDLNIATVGRVIEGMAHLSSLPRGAGPLGVYRPEAGERPHAIRRIVLAADLPAGERPAFEVLRTDGPAFDRYVLGRSNRSGTFFQRPAGGVDVCNAQVPVRRVATR